MARPKSDTRERLVEAAAALLRRQGYHGTGMAQIVAESGAPRGSVYFLFPGGKEELAAEAIAAAAADFAARLRAGADAVDPASLVAAMIGHLAEELRVSGFSRGCPITTVTLEVAPTSEVITGACRRAYDLWTDVIAEILTGFGITADRARELAVVGLATVEGALVLCRAAGTTDALDAVAPALTATLEQAVTTSVGSRN